MNLSVRYTELNRSLEQICEWSYFYIKNATIYGIAMLTLMVTAVNYFVYDLKDDSYFLPFLIV